VLYLDETLVDLAKRVKEIGFPISKFHWRSLIDAPPLSFVDRWSRISETGVVGDATLASKEKGERLFRVIVERFAELIEEFMHREIKPNRDHHR
jgi:creatinine amidohydrolase